MGKVREISAKMNLLNEDETVLYDRQIRLWGFDTQRKMKESRICIVAKKVNGLLNEV